MSAILTPGDHRAYTLKPHWAHAIAHSGKRCENRKGPIPKALQGKRVAIHAGAANGRHWFQDLAAMNAPIVGGHRSAFVATAVLAFCCEAGQSEQDPNDPNWADWGLFTWPWWWRLNDVRTLAKPVPVARGAQGPWRLTPEQVEAINAQGGGL